MQFIGCNNGSVIVRQLEKAAGDVATIELDGFGNCPDDAFEKYQKPFTLVIRDSTGNVKFQIGMGF